MSKYAKIAVWKLQKVCEVALRDLENEQMFAKNSTRNGQRWASLVTSIQIFEPYNTNEYRAR
jgi:hypothetical protein